MKPQKVKDIHKELEKVNPDVHQTYMVTEKIDGIYGYIDFNPYTGFSEICSMAGREIPALERYIELFQERIVTSYFPFRLIFEVYIPNTPFHIANGIFNRSKGEYHAEDACFMLHDLVFLDSETGEVKDHTALERYSLLKHIVMKTDERLDIAEVLYIGTGLENFRHYFNLVVGSGGEGIVLKQVNAPYKPDKRDSSLMKMKKLCQAELVCIDYYTTIGAKGIENRNLKLKSKEGAIIDVRVGRIADVAMLDETSPIGKVVGITAMEKLAGGKYREPRFNVIRWDKEVTDID